jgi:hypothetical protein
MFGSYSLDRWTTIAARGAEARGRLIRSSRIKPGSLPSLILPLRKFIAGEPMNPATKRLAGLS